MMRNTCIFSRSLWICNACTLHRILVIVETKEHSLVDLLVEGVGDQSISRNQITYKR
ncbi:hypothetical protein YC2023_106898 [Brassica napus]